MLGRRYTRYLPSFAAALATLAGAGLAACATTALAALPPAPPSQPALLPGFVTDEPVNALARGGGKIFLGGDFTRIGPATGGGVVLDPAGGLRAPQFPDVRRHGLRDRARRCGRLLRRRALRRRRRRAPPATSRTCSPAGPSTPHSHRRSTATSSRSCSTQGRLYIGGDFLHVGETIRRRIAALEPGHRHRRRRLQPGRRQERPGPRYLRQPPLRRRPLHRHRRPEPQLRRRPRRDERQARPVLRRRAQLRGRRRPRARYALLHRRRLHRGQRPQPALASPPSTSPPARSTPSSALDQRQRLQHLHRRHPALRGGPLHRDLTQLQQLRGIA